MLGLVDLLELLGLDLLEAVFDRGSVVRRGRAECRNHECSRICNLGGRRIGDDAQRQHGNVKVGLGLRGRLRLGDERAALVGRRVAVRVERGAVRRRWHAFGWVIDSRLAHDMLRHARREL
ncbi:MAG TPA: hypothetical protein VK034_10105, partial [Enhygromyxa sp.]|nr:hypothetical protein [Enhygromyxa sp.]